MPFAFIKFVHPRGGNYPDQGLPPGAPGAPDQGLPGDPAYPDQGLPGSPEYPSQGPIFGGRPPHIWPFPPGPPRPWPPLPWPPRPWPPVQWPPDSTDPDWGIDAGFAPSQPIYIPEVPGAPDQGLPPVAGHLPAPPTGGGEPPTVWPPLPVGLPEGEYWLLVAVIGLGYRYVKVSIPPPEASQNPIPTPSPTK